MAIFPSLILEPVVQVDDKTRLDGTKSFITSNEAAITLVEIEPISGNGFIDVSSTKYLDWQYPTDGTATVSIRITTDGAPITVTKTLEVLTEADDNLFSNDSDLMLHEHDILRYVPSGRNSFLNVHRRAQDRIVEWLAERGIYDSDGDKLTKTNIVDIDEVRQWSTFMALRFIYSDLSNAIDDVFDQKAKDYETLESRARNRSQYRFDFDGDGTVEDGEALTVSSSTMYRRG